MIPIPIPDSVAERGRSLGWERQIIAGPDGDLTGEVRPVDALVGMVRTSDGEIRPELNVLMQIEESDWNVLKENGGLFWISFTGHIVPFGTALFDPENEGTE